ncbi:MAG TPA: proton-conducting transporter membrane subunit [Thermoleophilaceae bacterium]
MNTLVPLTVVVPLVAATVLAATAPFASRRFADVVSLGTAAAVCTMSALLLAHGGELLYWFGGWHPRHGLALGISFTVAPLGAGLATFASAMVVIALLFSQRHLEEINHVFHALLLVFLAAMVGFVLSGDIFNLFVFFELMSVAAYALTGYRTDQRAPLEGTLNFAITNSIGALLVLTGIALLYGRTGALNLAQIGEALAARPGDSLVVIALTLLVAGFFVKAAVVPFHFWLPDAYAVAPTPVCVVLSAVMSELGLYAVARIWWSCFSGVFAGHHAAIEAILIGAGVLTALLGALLSFAQSHLKRMLAYATVSYIGLFLIGFALLTPDGLAGTAIYLVADGCVKAALFVGVGILQHRLWSADELRLRGEGRGMPYTAALFVLGGLALASLPPFGTFLGKSLIEDAAVKAGYGWVIVVFVIASALTGAAVLRAAGRVFLGLGPGGEPEPSFEIDREESDEPETEEPRDRTPALLFVPAAVLVAAALALGLMPGLEHAALRAATAFVDRQGYAAAVLRGAPAPAPHVSGPPAASALDYLYALLSVLGALGLAAFALMRPLRSLGPGVTALRRLHSGRVGDYVAWLTLGVAAFGGLFAVTLLPGG